MADMHLCYNLEELRAIINKQHLLYLISYETPGKLDQREKLENCIKQYLHVAPHNQKFTFPQTAQVLHRSVSEKENFSARKACAAWKAVGKYADNLVVQPWRKEFKDVKLYCGFYKHEIEENLVEPELMFEAMGYCHIGNSTMTIADILDPDRITSVSKDAIIAYVECQILKQIWESLPPHYNFSWLEVLEFRENHTGTPRQAVRCLTYKRQRRQYEEQLYRRAQYHTTENHPRPDYIYGSNIGYYNHAHYPGHSYFPPQARPVPGMSAPPVVSPSSMYPSPVQAGYPPQHVLKPQDLYPPNGYHSHSHYAPLMNAAQPMQDHYPNYAGYHSFHQQQPSVPTAQLIELDQYTDRTQNTGRYPGDEGVASKWQESDENDGGFPSTKAKDDGAGSWENWHYVYKNLENQGYKKNLSSRGDVLSLKGSHSSRHNSGDQDSKAVGDLSDKMRKVTVGASSAGKLDASDRNGSEADDEAKSRSARKGSSANADLVREQDKIAPSSKGADRSSPEKMKRIAGASSINPTAASKMNSTDSVNISRKKESEGSAPRDRKISKQSEKNEEEEEGEGAEEKWQCITCTYLNSMDKRICKMCCKSKERGDESKPQPTGGQVCSNCTLVNEPGQNFCNACNRSLKDSPIYI